ncbi:MAG: beta-propeller domain-containing protein [Pseudomonadota bacterium]
MRIVKALAGSALLCGLAACASLPDPERGRIGIPTFANGEEIDAYIAAQRRARKAFYKRLRKAGAPDDRIIVTGARAEEVSITNVQEAGVDEGGIVKATGEHLVILRRGKVYVARYADGALEKVSSIDAFPPSDPNPDDTWYDEMLLSGDTVTVIGYSYGGGATEISRFRLSDAGALSYLDTYYLSSYDYYSSRNYATRMIDGELFTYSPGEFDEDWREDLPQLERRLEDGTRERVEVTLKVEDIGLSAAQLEPVAPFATHLHTFTRCDVFAPQLTCSARAVLGTRSAEYYFSREAAYLWTEEGRQTFRRYGGDNEDRERHVLYRIPFGGSETEAIRVSGAPVDQFSFHEDEETDSLFVLTAGDFTFSGTPWFGLTMWDSEFSDGPSALVQIPLGELGNGAGILSPARFRPLPSPGGWRVQNRFVGRHLLYGGGDYDDEGETPQLYVTPLDAPWVQRIDLPHGVSRLDRLGADGVAVGQDGERRLGFSAIELNASSGSAKLGSTSLLPAADEGENRSQAFFWRPDPSDPDSGNGVMALPVDKELENSNFEFLGSATAMAFLARDNGELTQIGELGTYPDEWALAQAEKLEALDEEGECQASCVDWYGNARPIFIGERIFALMGDQLVEGRIEAGVMREIKRINFAR